MTKTKKAETAEVVEAVKKITLGHELTAQVTDDVIVVHNRMIGTSIMLGKAEVLALLDVMQKWLRAEE